MGPGVLEHECGFSFAALPGGAVRADGRAGPGCFAARGPLCPDAGRTAGGAGCLSGVEWGNFSGPLFLSGAAGRRLVVLGGAVCYLAGLGLCAATVASFASPGRLGLNTAGAYRFSRNPMYAAYFICFLGMALLAKSLFLAGAVLVFQLSARWLVLAEERWCEEIFGEEYRQYKKQVRRWL